MEPEQRSREDRPRTQGEASPRRDGNVQNRLAALAEEPAPEKKPRGVWLAREMEKRDDLDMSREPTEEEIRLQLRMPAFQEDFKDPICTWTVTDADPTFPFIPFSQDYLTRVENYHNRTEDWEPPSPPRDVFQVSHLLNEETLANAETGIALHPAVAPSKPERFFKSKEDALARGPRDEREEVVLYDHQCLIRVPLEECVTAKKKEEELERANRFAPAMRGGRGRGRGGRGRGGDRSRGPPSNANYERLGDRDRRRERSRSPSRSSYGSSSSSSRHARSDRDRSREEAPRYRSRSPRQGASSSSSSRYGHRSSQDHDRDPHSRGGYSSGDRRHEASRDRSSRGDRYTSSRDGYQTSRDSHPSPRGSHDTGDSSRHRGADPRANSSSSSSSSAARTYAEWRAMKKEKGLL